MTIKEVSEKYNIAESSIKTKFKRTQDAILKQYGVKIVKYGRGDKAYYLEEEEEVHALTLFEETKEELILSEEDIALDKWAFYVMLAIAATPQCVFRGRYEDMLIYLGVPLSNKGVVSLKGALSYLDASGIIIYKEDKSTAENFFIAAFYRSIERKVEVSIKTIKIVKELADKNHITQWVNLLKVMQAIEWAAENNSIFTMKMLENYCGLSENTIRKYKTVLEQNNIIKTSKAFIAANVCLGQTAALNAFEL